MGRTRFLSLLTAAFFVLLFCSQGFGRKVMGTVEHQDSNLKIKESEGISREMIELMDYEETGPNTNTRGGFIPLPPQP